MKTVNLQVKGRRMKFTKAELETILEEYYFDFNKIPKEGKWFKVNPLAIDVEIFEFSRQDSKQEFLRQIILDAFVEVQNNPKYAKPFKTLIPNKNWAIKDIDELKELPAKLGYHIADWVEQAFEWAQRIVNGESWEDLCNKPDTSNWYRLVVWKDGYTRFIGGSCIGNDTNSAACVSNYNVDSVYILSGTVPLMVSY